MYDPQKIITSKNISDIELVPIQWNKKNLKNKKKIKYVTILWWSFEMEDKD